MLSTAALGFHIESVSLMRFRRHTFLCIPLRIIAVVTDTLGKLNNNNEILYGRLYNLIYYSSCTVSYNSQSTFLTQRKPKAAHLNHYRKRKFLKRLKI